jgi:hypothetical protein
MNFKVGSAIIFFSDSSTLLGYYWNYLKLCTGSCHNLLCSQSSALLVPSHLFCILLKQNKDVSRNKRTLILTEWLLFTLHIQHYTRGNTSVRLLYMMMNITKTQYLWTTNDEQMVYKHFGTEGYSNIL